MRLLDERGTRWNVQAGDPARRHVSALTRRGFDFIVLPRYTYLTGELRDTSPPGDLIQAVRLEDCLAVLNGRV